MLTSTIANRWLSERVLARQWFGLALGVRGVYLVLQEKQAYPGWSESVIWGSGAIVPGFGCALSGIAFGLQL